MPFPPSVDCQHINCVKHGTVRADEASVSRNRMENSPELLWANYKWFFPRHVSRVKFSSPSIFHKSCFIFRNKIRQEICHTPFLKHRAVSLVNISRLVNSVLHWLQFQEQQNLFVASIMLTITMCIVSAKVSSTKSKKRKTVTFRMFNWLLSSPSLLKDIVSPCYWSSESRR